MFRLTFSLIIAGLLWIAAAPQADAQTVCGPRAELLERLTKVEMSRPLRANLVEHRQRRLVVAQPVERLAQ